MHSTYVYLNGEILPLEQAAISPLDIGLLRGYAVFDLLRTVGGRPFLLAEHLHRLRASADELDLRVPATDGRIAEAIDELLRLNGHGEGGGEATVRLVLTGGVSEDGMTFNPDTPTFFILTHELHEPPDELYENGGKLLTKEHGREVPAAKTTNYLTMLRHRPQAAEEGALDLLYHAGGTVSEAASASFYIVKGRTIMAPSTDVLHGTIGSFVLDTARDTYDVLFGEFTIDDACEADEAFLTSTTRGIVPIVQLDDRPVGDGTVGTVTRDLMARFRAALAAL